MKKIYFLLAAVAIFAACNPNEPSIPEGNTPATAFADAKFFTALGTNTAPNVECDNHDQPFTMDSVRSEVVLLTDSTLDIYLFGINFSSKMPVTIDMTIPGVSYKRTAESLILTGDSLVPLMGERPFDRYVITALTGTITEKEFKLKNGYGSYADCTYEGVITGMEKQKPEE
jgi:hypothetical protein